MARYIDADFVANGLREHLPPDDDEHREALDQLTYAISILQFAPTADVAPVIHAHWIKAFFPGSVECDLPVLLDATCSNCDFKMWHLFPYCPQCGALMDEEVE